MSTNFQFKRGTTAALSGVTGLAGELMVDLTKNTLVVHDGSTAGGFPLALEGATPDLSAYSTTVEMNSAISTATSGLVTQSDLTTAIAGVSAGAPDLTAASVGGLGDVDTTTTAPTTGQALVWDGTNWVPGTVASSGGASVLNDLTDVNAGAPVDQGLLYWSQSAGQWQTRLESTDSDTLGGVSAANFLRTDVDGAVDGKIEFKKGIYANDYTRNGGDTISGFFLQTDGASSVITPTINNRLAYGRMSANGFVTSHTTTGRNVPFADYEVDRTLTTDNTSYMSVPAADFIDANTDVVFEINFGTIAYSMVAGVVFGGPKNGFGPSYCHVEAFSEGAWVTVEEDTTMEKNIVGGRVTTNQAIGCTALRITMRKDTATDGANDVRIATIFATKDASVDYALVTRGGGDIYGHVDAKADFAVRGTTNLYGLMNFNGEIHGDATDIKDIVWGDGTVARPLDAASAVHGSFTQATHDIAAFYHTRNTVTQELRTNAVWGADTQVHTGLFAGKQNVSQNIIDATDITNLVDAARWTFQGGMAWSSVGVVRIGFQYMATPPDVNVIIETSADSGVTWTQRHSSTVTGISSAREYEFGVGYFGGDSWMRITIESNGLLTLSNISLISARVGDTGIGREVEVPFEWDADRNINFLGDVDVAGTFTVGGLPISGGSGATTLGALTDVDDTSTAGQVLTSDGAGNFTFTTVSDGAGDVTLTGTQTLSNKSHDGRFNVLNSGITYTGDAYIPSPDGGVTPAINGSETELRIVRTEDSVQGNPQDLTRASIGIPNYTNDLVFRGPNGATYDETAPASSQEEIAKYNSTYRYWQFRAADLDVATISNSGITLQTGVFTGDGSGLTNLPVSGGATNVKRVDTVSANGQTGTISIVANGSQTDLDAVTITPSANGDVITLGNVAAGLMLTSVTFHQAAGFNTTTSWSLEYPEVGGATTLVETTFPTGLHYNNGGVVQAANLWTIANTAGIVSATKSNLLASTEYFLTVKIV